MLEIILQYGKISRNVVFVWTCWYFYLFSTRFFYYWCCVNYNEPTQHWWKSQKNCKKSRKIKNFPERKRLFSSGGETGIRSLLRPRPASRHSQNAIQGIFRATHRSDSNPFHKIKTSPKGSCRFQVAERQGFEPWSPCGLPVFKTGAFDHSAISPGCCRKQCTQYIKNFWFVKIFFDFSCFKNLFRKYCHFEWLFWHFHADLCHGIWAYQKK